MPHVDPDLLAVHALGEELPDDQAAHLATCPDCAAEARSLRRVVEMGRSLEPHDSLVPPPSGVWAGIAAETGADPGALDAPAATDAGANGRPDGRAGGDGAGGGGGWRGSWVLAASVAGIVAGAAGALGWQAIQPDPAPPVVATAVLDPLAEPAAAGTASLVETDGERELVVNLEPPEVDGFLQVWLLTPDAAGLVPLGVLTNDGEAFLVPAGLDLGEFPVVDVSIEPFDGDPGHSGDSVVRGTLSET